MIRDIHVFLLDTGNVKLGSDLLCGENTSLKFDPDERVDRYYSHPCAIRGILEFHTAYEAVVTFRPRTDGHRRLTSIAASSEEPAKPLAPPAVWMVPRAGL